MPNLATYEVVDIPAQSHYLTAIKFLATTTVVGGGAIFICDATAGNFTVTLPDAELYSERTLTFKLISATNAVTIEAEVGQTIDGSGSVGLSTQYDFVTVVSDGSDWHIIGI